MNALTMDNNVFVLVTDNSAPTRAEYLQAVEQAQAQAQSQASPSGSAASPGRHASTHMTEPPHYKNTFLTVSPPGALEQLLTQLGSRWVPTRQRNTTHQRHPSGTTGQQLVVEGSIFSIGTDWRVRVGNVILTGGAVKGMLLEAEYLPLPNMRSLAPDGSSELLTSLLTSVLPPVPNASAVAVAVSDSQWEEALWNRADGEEEKQLREQKAKEIGLSAGTDADLYAYEDEETPSMKQKGDWTGVDRDRRSAYLIIGALSSEGIL